MTEMSDPAPAPAPAPAPVANWYDGKGFDTEHVAHIQTKGWDKLDPTAAAVAAVMAHRAAEKIVGVPADEILRIPKTPTDPGWQKVYERLGAPVDPAKYEFPGLKVGDQDITPDVTDFLRATAAKLHLPVDAAKTMAADIVAKINADLTAANVDRTAKVETEKAALKANWGNNAAVHEMTARRAAAALGVDANMIGALESVAGYAKVMDMFRSIGEKIGEDKFLTGGSMGGKDGLLTREQASTRRSELMKDTAWVDRYLNGGTAEQREMTSLNTILSAQVGR
jgi:hypothetical protein